MPDFVEQDDINKYASNQAGPIEVFNAATSGTSARYQTYAGLTRHMWTVVWSSGVTAGAITIKGGLHTDQTETFGEIVPEIDVTMAPSNGANSTDVIERDGVLFAWEVEITKPVVGGTVTVWYAGRD